METIHRVLKTGGVWGNYGPLFYHYAEGSEKCLELSWEEVRHAIMLIGFEIRVNFSEFWNVNWNRVKKLSRVHMRNWKERQWRLFITVYSLQQ